MKILVILLFTSCCASSFYAQVKRSSYTQFSLSIPLRSTLDSDIESDDWFVPDGLSAKVGGGLHYNKRIALGINSGIDWIGSKKLVIIPVYGTIKLSTKIGKENLYFIQAGYGESIFIGRQGKTGDYKKIGIGFEDYREDFSLFAEYVQYGIILLAPEKVWNISLGLSITTFKNRNRRPNPTSYQ